MVDGWRHWLTKYANKESTFHDVATFLTTSEYCANISLAAMLWNVLSLFAYFVSQCLHPSSYPYIWDIFPFQIFCSSKFSANWCATTIYVGMVVE